MQSVFHYDHAHQFLKDAWEEKRKRNPSFSLRAWAKQLGMKNHAPLHLMLSGQRPIPKKYVPNFIDKLGLSAKEGLFLEALVEMGRASTMVQREFYAQRLREIAPEHNAGNMREVESFKYLKDPLHMTLLEMTVLSGFKSDPKWIQSRLASKTTLVEIEAAIERLIHLGLLQENPDGTLIKTNQSVTSKKDQVDLGLQEFHKNVSRLAAEMISQQPIAEREFNAYAMNIKTGALPLAKELIRKFAQDFIAQVEADAETGEKTYQLNVQFFSLTKSPNPKEIVQ